MLLLDSISNVSDIIEIVKCTAACLGNVFKRESNHMPKLRTDGKEHMYSHQL